MKRKARTNKRRRWGLSFSGMSWFRPRLRQQFLSTGLFVLSLVFAVWLLINNITLRSASLGSVDAFFVLGGSINREIYVAELAKQYPQTPILISKGSQSPCVWLIFQQLGAPLQNVWLERCADSTFENFYFSFPILRRWGVHKVGLITSPTHLPRAQWMAQIILGAHGIWVEPYIVHEQGIPGNQESWFKTGIDLTRSLFWAALSQVIEPQCSSLTSLTDVDMKYWQRRGFKCEHQGNVKLLRSQASSG